MATFPERYAAARKALDTAERHTRPLPDDLTAELAARYPERYAKAEREVAEIAATLPALRAEVDALAERACHRCLGTGVYGGPTNARRRGVAYCFYCNGTGEAR